MNIDNLLDNIINGIIKFKGVSSQTFYLHGVDVLTNTLIKYYHYKESHNSIHFVDMNNSKWLYSLKLFNNKISIDTESDNSFLPESSDKDEWFNFEIQYGINKSTKDKIIQSNEILKTKLTLEYQLLIDIILP